jgi:hypothetical protein
MATDREPLTPLEIAQLQERTGVGRDAPITADILNAYRPDHESNHHFIDAEGHHVFQCADCGAPCDCREHRPNVFHRMLLALKGQS